MRWQVHNVFRNKYKRILIFLVGIFCVGLILIVQTSDFGKKNVSDTNTNKTQNKLLEPGNQMTTLSYTEQLEQKLATALQKIDGVGQVVVIITVKTNGELILNKDQPKKSSESNENDGEGSVSETNETEDEMVTTFIKNGDGSETPIIIKEIVPEVSGVLIIAEGGDNIVVQSNLIQAAKVLLDLPANKIEILKMVS